MIEPKTNMDESEPFVLEEPRPLSQSLLWKIQRNFFKQQGAAAWGEHIVPFYITTNPFIANAYAQVVLGFLRDCHAATSVGTTDSFGTLDPGQPIYIVELGS